MQHENPFWDLPQHERDRLRREADAAEAAVADNDARILAQLEQDTDPAAADKPMPERYRDLDPWDPEAW